ncbi:MAG: transport-associated protein [Gammaproteobacteria bacterium]|nr:transport-associated protein [Gammaproteobacteria bacterium]
MHTNHFILVVALMAIFGLGVVGCDYNDGPAEEMGEKLDQSVEKAGDKMQELGDEAKDAVDQ